MCLLCFYITLASLNLVQVMKQNKNDSKQINDRTCLNCGTFVSRKFCPDCGQRLESTHHTFSFLVKEFIADLVHYDSSFWRTTRTLLFSPSTLSLEFLKGKHRSFVNPVKLYIFISFLAFFIPSILPTPNKNSKSSTIIPEKTWTKKSEFYYIPTYGKVRNVEHLDSIHSNKPEAEKSSYTKYLYQKYRIKANQNMDTEETYRQIQHFLTANVSKAIFVYMPVFAFWMWLFHIRKKRTFFDNGIFTLHFFSFVMLSITLVILINNFMGHVGLSVVTTYIATALGIYITYYFLKSLRRFYTDSRWATCYKGLILMLVHFFSVLFILIGYVVFALLKDYD